jgi:S-adenosylmethionine:tRNA ribosyltransferase-isomerase
MRIRDFSYSLPPELIAQRPLSARTDSRLMVLDGTADAPSDHAFGNLADHLRSGDLLILNDTRVIPARLFGRKDSGGAIEILVERLTAPNRAWAHIRASKGPRVGSVLWIGEEPVLEVAGRQDGLFLLQGRGARTLESLLTRHGHIPLPPYVRRADNALDRERYQTVYARNPGAVAAPTAGLHFDSAMLDVLVEKGVEVGFLTLHVGAGTFQPIRTDDITTHRLHAERVSVSADLVERIGGARKRGGRVIAVGTTVVRALETASTTGALRQFEGETRIFIYPGYRFRVVDALVTNFHLPESTLLMLVCAFGGYRAVMSAYQAAVARRYRFFSYGDAMFLTRARQPDLPPDSDP